MRRVVHREVGGGSGRRTAAAAEPRRAAAKAGGFGRLLAQLGSASSALDRSRARVGR